jgi:hypothetical protein
MQSCALSLLLSCHARGRRIGLILRAAQAAVLTSICCVAVSCGPHEDSNEAAVVDKNTPEIIATIGTEQLTRVEFEAELMRRSRSFESAFASPEMREKVLAEMIRSKAALARAKESGFDQKPEVISQVQQLIASRYIEETLDSKPTSELQIKDSAIADFYSNHLDQFSTPQAIRAGVIVLEISEKATADKRRAARLRAETIRGAALSSSIVEFNQLVQRYSEDQSTRYIGGDAGWLDRKAFASRWPDEVAQAAFALNSAGEVAPVVEASGKLFIIRLNEHRESAARPLSEVAEAIRYQLLQIHRQERQEAINRAMTNGLTIHVNREALAKIATAQKNKLPPGLPN